MGWIKCSDRLPEPETFQDEYIICTFDGLVMASWFERDEKIFKDAHNGCIIMDITHWMPLPEPPEDL